MHQSFCIPLNIDIQNQSSNVYLTLCETVLDPKRVKVVRLDWKQNSICRFGETRWPNKMKQVGKTDSGKIHKQYVLRECYKVLLR